MIHCSDVGGKMEMISMQDERRPPTAQAVRMPPSSAALTGVGRACRSQGKGGVPTRYLFCISHLPVIPYRFTIAICMPYLGKVQCYAERSTGHYGSLLRPFHCAVPCVWGGCSSPALRALHPRTQNREGFLIPPCGTLVPGPGH